MLYKKLRALKGKSRVVYKAYDKSDKNVNRQLVGRVSKLGSIYVLRVTIVEGESGKRLFDKTISSKENENLNSTAEQIAGQINSKDSIWKVSK